ncbi:Acid-sensing ion channel 1A [Trichinella spiralis]|uniref:Acid-sensing ion channel 1A n=1 Tax=Trichinella spiralis TaxID=6334 RepID=A0ABR3L045_TRISP
MLALTVNSGSKMLGRSTCKSLSHNFPLLLITAAVCYQVAVTWALDNTAMGKNGLLYDKQNRTETMKRNISNEYLPNENAENNNKTDVKATVFETPTEKENITEFVIKAPQTPITLTPQTTTPIPTNFSEKVEPANNRSKEHTDEILNVVNGSKTYGNDNVSEKLKAGKTNGSDVEFETPPPNFVITSTLAPINCTQTVNYKGTNRNACIGMSITFIALTFIAVICLCVFHFQPMKTLRDIVERRRNGENHHNFCISTRAEQEMVSFGEKLNEA